MAAWATPSGGGTRWCSGPRAQPRLADAFFLCFAPPAIVGLLVLAKRPVTRAGWVCLALDAWLIGGSLLTLAWSLALAQAAMAGRVECRHGALSVAYPLLDIVLVSMVLALHFRRSRGQIRGEHRDRRPGLTVVCDAVFTSPLLRTSYSSGQLLDAGWFAVPCCSPTPPGPRSGAGGRRWTTRDRRSHPRGARARARTARRRSRTCTPRRAVRATARPGPDRAATGRHGRPIAGSLAALTPYLAAAVCTLGILYNVVDGRRVDRVVMFTGGTVVLALVVRQGIMLLDNIALTQELAQKENHFRSLVQGSSDVIMIAAPSGILRYVSPAAAGVYGRAAEELVGSDLAVSSTRGSRPGGARGAPVPGGQPGEDPPRASCGFRSGEAAGSSRVDRQPAPGRAHLQQPGRHRTREAPGAVAAQRRARAIDLPNRALFTCRVRQALTGRRAGDGAGGTAVLFIDLDGFKGVNDTIGHQAGDELLVQAARRLQEAVREGDAAARRAVTSSPR
ncbi:EAL domain-containing protein [Streptomyces violaceorubidus]